MGLASRRKRRISRLTVCEISGDRAAPCDDQRKQVQGAAERVGADF